MMLEGAICRTLRAEAQLIFNSRYLGCAILKLHGRSNIMIYQFVNEHKNYTKTDKKEICFS